MHEELQLKVRKLCVADENLKGVTMAIFVTDGFEQVELTQPKKAFQEAGVGDAGRVAQGRPGPRRLI